MILMLIQLDTEGLMSMADKYKVNIGQAILMRDNSPIVAVLHSINMMHKGSMIFDSIVVHKIGASKSRLPTIDDSSLTADTRIGYSTKICSRDENKVELKLPSRNRFDLNDSMDEDKSGSEPEKKLSQTGGSTGKATLEYVMILRRLFIDPWKSEQKCTHLEFLNILEEILAPLRSIVSMVVESIVLSIEIPEETDDSLRSTELQPEVLLGPKLNKQESAEEDSFEDEASGEFYKNRRYVIHVLFDYLLTTMSQTVGRLAVLQIEGKEGEDFYDAARCITDIDLMDKDSENYIKTCDFSRFLDRWQFGHRFKVVFYSTDLGDMLSKGNPMQSYIPAIVYSSAKVVLSSVVLECGLDSVEIKHYVPSEFLKLDKTLRLRDCYFHSSVGTSDSGIIRYLVHHKSTIERRVQNGIDMFNDDDSWKHVGTMRDEHEQWLTKAKSIKLHILKTSRSTIGGTILEKSNLFKTSKSSCVEPRSYGFTEVLYLKEVSRLVGHLKYHLPDKKKASILESDGLLFRIKHFVLTGTVPTVTEALNVAFPSLKLWDSITENQDTINRSFTNCIDWSNIKSCDMEDNDFESVDPTIIDTLSLIDLQRSIGRSSVTADNFTVRLFWGVDFQLVDLKSADEILLEGLAQSREMNNTASVSYANMTTTKHGFNAGFITLPRIIENQRQSNYVEIEMSKYRIDSLVVDSRFFKKIKVNSLVVKEYGKVGSVLRVILKIENLSLLFEKRETGNKEFNFRHDTGSSGMRKMSEPTESTPKSKCYLNLNLILDSKVEVNISPQTETLLSKLIDDGSNFDDSSIDLGVMLGLAVFQLVFDYDAVKQIDGDTLLSLCSTAFVIDFTQEDLNRHRVVHKVAVPHVNILKSEIGRRLLDVYESKLLPMVEKANPHLNIENYIKRLPVFLAAYQSARAVISQTKQTSSLRDTEELRKIASVMAEGGKNIGSELWNGFKRLIHKN